jgi:hypothetical protein
MVYKHQLKKSGHYTTTQISDIRFYVLFAVFAIMLKKSLITPGDIISIQLSDITDRLINETAQMVFDAYLGLGGDDKVAKGPELIVKLKEELEARFAAEVEC